MQLDNYLEYLEKTAEAYPNKVKNYLVRQFLKNGIATKQMDTDGQLCFDGMEMIDISDKSLTEQLMMCIRQSKRAVHYLEKWEFVKDYKYSVLFTCENFEETLEQVKSIKPFDDEYENEYLFTNFAKPLSYETDEYFILKFNLAYAALHPLTQEEFLVKYPFLVVFHKNGNIIEFRFDVLKRVFLSEKREQTVYSDLISKMIHYFEEQYSCILQPLNLDFMVNVCKTDETVKLIAQYMKLANGGNAQLEVGNNQEYVLPWLNRYIGD